MRRMLNVAALLVAPTTLLAVGASQVTATEKSEFIQLLNSLPKDGEFYSQAAIDRAAPKIHVLHALTEKDLDGRDFYPIIALIRGLCDLAPSQRYALDHFSEIEHPTIKLSWAAMLFQAKARSSSVVSYLRKALGSPQQENFLSELLGPEFPAFKNQILHSPQ